MKLLMLVSEYPGFYKGGQGSNVTNTVHYYAREWVKAGHEVIVVHNAHRYPIIVHMLPKIIKDWFVNKYGFAIFDTDFIKSEEYQIDNVHVFRLPMFKVIPHGSHPKPIIRRQVKRLIRLLTEQNFRPDCIMGHWGSPQLQLISELKEVYNCPTSIVFHGTSYLQNPSFHAEKFISNIDTVGFRNRKDLIIGRKYIGDTKDTFICYSGVTPNFLSKKPDYSKFETMEPCRILYVGRLIERKKIDVLLDAIKRSAIPSVDLTIIGEGPLKESLKEKAAILGLSDQIHFVGQLDREQTIEFYHNSHIFAMVSQDEAFGMTYVEAMSAGCITIGSKNEGIDGVLIDHKNGFLCESGNVEALTKVLNEIVKMSHEQYISISSAARNTAEMMTDENLAKKYLSLVTKELGECN